MPHRNSLSSHLKKEVAREIMRRAGFRPALREDMTSDRFMVHVDPAYLSQNTTSVVPGRTPGTTLVQLEKEPLRMSTVVDGLEVVHFHMALPAFGRSSYAPLSMILENQSDTLWFVETD